jgi:hypothetical protein
LFSPARTVQAKRRRPALARRRQPNKRALGSEALEAFPGRSRPLPVGRERMRLSVVSAQGPKPTIEESVQHVCAPVHESAERGFRVGVKCCSASRGVPSNVFQTAVRRHHRACGGGCIDRGRRDPHELGARERCAGAIAAPISLERRRRDRSGLVRGARICSRRFRASDAMRANRSSGLVWPDHSCAGRVGLADLRHSPPPQMR